MDEATRTMVEEAYYEAASEAIAHGLTALTAHKEAVVAAAMLLAALDGQEDNAARAAVVALDLRPTSIAA